MSKEFGESKTNSIENSITISQKVKITRKTFGVSESDKVKDSIMNWQKVEQKVHQNVITFFFEP